MLEFYQRFRGACFLRPQSINIFILALKAKKVCFSETLTSTYDSTRRQNPQEQQFYVKSVFFPQRKKSGFTQILELAGTNILCR